MGATQKELDEMKYGAPGSSAPLTVEKILYAKRFNTTGQQILEILDLEVDTHLRKYPHLAYDKFTGPVENADRSRTYTLHFRIADAEPAE